MLIITEFDRREEKVKVENSNTWLGIKVGGIVFAILGGIVSYVQTHYIPFFMWFRIQSVLLFLTSLLVVTFVLFVVRAFRGRDFSDVVVLNLKIFFLWWAALLMLDVVLYWSHYLWYLINAPGLDFKWVIDETRIASIERFSLIYIYTQKMVSVSFLFVFPLTRKFIIESFQNIVHLAKTFVVKRKEKRKSSRWGVECFINVMFSGILIYCFLLFIPIIKQSIYKYWAIAFQPFLAPTRLEISEIEKKTLGSANESAGIIFEVSALGPCYGVVHQIGLPLVAEAKFRNGDVLPIVMPSGPQPYPPDHFQLWKADLADIGLIENGHPSTSAPHYSLRFVGHGRMWLYLLRAETAESRLVNPFGYHFIMYPKPAGDPISLQIIF